MIHLSKLTFLLLLLKTTTCVTDATLASDATANQVKVQFDWSSLSQWNDYVLSQFKSVVASSVEAFCQNNQTECGMSNFKAFSSSDVVIVPDYPQEQRVNSLMMFYVVLPSGTASNSDIFVVRKTALTSVIIDDRLVIQQQLITAAKEEYEAAFRISYVNDVLVLPPSDQTMNLIMTPIACGVVLVLVILIIGLDVNKKMRRKSQLKAITSKQAQKTSAQPSSKNSDTVFQTSNSTAM